MGFAHFRQNIKLCDRLDNIADYASSPDRARARRYAEQTKAMTAAVGEDFCPKLVAMCNAEADGILADIVASPNVTMAYLAAST